MQNLCKNNVKNSNAQQKRSQNATKDQEEDDNDESANRQRSSSRKRDSSSVPPPAINTQVPVLPGPPHNRTAPAPTHDRTTNHALPLTETTSVIPNADTFSPQPPTSYDIAVPTISQNFQTAPGFPQPPVVTIDHCSLRFIIPPDAKQYLIDINSTWDEFVQYLSKRIPNETIKTLTFTDAEQQCWYLNNSSAFAHLCTIAPYYGVVPLIPHIAASPAAMGPSPAAMGQVSYSEPFIFPMICSVR